MVSAWRTHALAHNDKYYIQRDTHTHTDTHILDAMWFKRYNEIERKRKQLQIGINVIQLSIQELPKKGTTFSRSGVIVWFGALVKRSVSSWIITLHSLLNHFDTKFKQYSQNDNSRQQSNNPHIYLYTFVLFTFLWHFNNTNCAFYSSYKSQMCVCVCLYAVFFLGFFERK